METGTPTSTVSVARPPLSSRQMLDMAIGFLGLQFAWQIQMGQMSSLYKTMGASDTEFSIFWMAGPITGILVQPIIGSLSDRTWTRMGRRRPFFLIGAVLTAVVLLLMPNVTFFMPTLLSALVMAAALLWVLDASINTSMGPYRALIPDIAPPQQHATANAWIGWAIGLGAVASAQIGSLDIHRWLGGDKPELTSGFNRFILKIAPTNTHILFYVGAVTVLLAIGYTVLRVKEYPPEDMDAFRKAKANRVGFGRWVVDTWKSILHMPKDMAKLCLVQFFTWFPFFCLFIFFTVYVAENIYQPNSKPMPYAAAVQKLNEMEGSATRVKWSVASADKGGLVALTVQGKDGGPVTEIAPTLKIASEDAVFLKLREQGKSFDLAPTPGRPEGKGYTVCNEDVYGEGNRWAQQCFMIWNVVCLFAAMIIGPLADRFGKKLMHSIGLLAMAAGFGIFFFSMNATAAMIGMGILGIGWATTVTMPYALLAGIIPKGSEGLLMGTFNIFICIPQLVCAATMGWIVDLLGNRPFAFAVAAVSALIAMLVLQAVKEEKPAKA